MTAHLLKGPNQMAFWIHRQHLVAAEAVTQNHTMRDSGAR